MSIKAKINLAVAIVALVLAIPITITLVSQQQDIRQRAQIGDLGNLRNLSAEDLQTLKSLSLTPEELETLKTLDRDSLINFLKTRKTLPSLTISPRPTLPISILPTIHLTPTTSPTTAPTPTCTPRPACLDGVKDPVTGALSICSVVEPPGGFCAKPMPTISSCQSNSDCRENARCVDNICTPFPTILPCSDRSRGEANCDGRIDLLDFNAWRAAFLRDIPNPSDLIADFNNDGRIDLLDFNIWRTEFIKSSVAQNP